MYQNQNHRLAVFYLNYITVCVVLDGCLTNPCENGGTCVPVGPLSFKCVCEPGYIGRTCDKANDAAVNCNFADGYCVFRNDDSDQLDMRRMFVSTKYNEVR